MAIIELALVWLLSAADQTAARSAVAGPDLLSKAQATAFDASHGQVLYAKHCVACHGKRGWGDGPREIPAVAGQRRGYLIEQLARFATGERPGSEMHGPAMRDSLQPPDVDRPQAIADLAAYLAQLAPDRQSEHGDGQALARGQKLYAASCVACHGSDGTGDGAGSIPRVAGQHFPYLVSQLQRFALVHHGSLDAKAVQLAPSEQQAVADYLSRLGQ